MQSLVDRIQELNRPRLLVRAARNGAGLYRRSRDLRRVLRMHPPQRQGEILIRLLEREAMLEQARRAHAPGYSLFEHVDVLCVLVAESALFLPTRMQQHCMEVEHTR